MESVNRIVDYYVDKYLEETESPFTKAEFYTHVQHLIPLRIDDDPEIVGILGLDVFPSQYLQENVPVLKVIYIDPIHRKPHSFKDAVRTIFNSLKTQGFKRVEIHTNKKINNWFRRELHSKPNQYIHLQDLEFYCKQLEEGK